MSEVHHHETLVVAELSAKMRIDLYVAQNLPNFSRSQASAETTEFSVDGREVKKSYLVENGQTISVRWSEFIFSGVQAQPLPLTILYEDEALVVIDKAQSMVVHPAAGNWEGTLVNALAHRYGSDFVDASDEPIRPGVVHRLDKETSGVMVVAKNNQAKRHLSDQFKARTVTKYYVALVRGTVERKRGSITTSLARSKRNRKKIAVDPKGRSAHTDYLVLRQFESCALLRLVLHTGRTHQIRVHLASLGHPIIGDELYGRGNETSLMLHASRLEFDHPESGERLRFRSTLPGRFKHYLEAIQAL